MKKIYKPLTNEQQMRGVIFSSQLLPGGRIHEVIKDDDDAHNTIKRLLDDSFFNDSPYKRNEIRQ